MNQIKKVDLLKEAFQNGEIDLNHLKLKIQDECDSMSDEELLSFSKEVEKEAISSCESAEKLYHAVDIKLRLASILDILPMSYIAEKYFKKSHSWFSQRLNNHLVNGIPASFTDKELTILSKALDEIGQKLKDTAHSIA
ncbi:DUF5053 domain-containing protein [Massilibacteroides sp.]|uniref:DUF5053 domain-containing protein n=1 Tax=Massilibacteroides sp. TaxID=2034766 RepID=UPI0026165949|nr:DUF5053 domain-containing protein [Massilibacteroides sp.]MDD4514453.1 DUF5053 domain-containing protein [Massilibacteroides sp.]